MPFTVKSSWRGQEKLGKRLEGWVRSAQRLGKVGRRSLSRTARWPAVGATSGNSNAFSLSGELPLVGHRATAAGINDAPRSRVRYSETSLSLHRLSDQTLRPTNMSSRQTLSPIR